MDGNGRLDQWEIRQVFKDVGVVPSEEEMREIIQTIATSTDGEGLTYDEFVSVLEKDQVVAEEGDERETVEAYVAMGGLKDKSGCVDAERIKKVIQDFGLTINIDELLELLDTDHSGQIEFDEFKCLFEEEEGENEGQAMANPLSSNARLLKLDSDDEEEEADQIQVIPVDDTAGAGSNVNASSADPSNNFPVFSVPTISTSSIGSVSQPAASPTRSFEPRPPTAVKGSVAPSPRHR